MAPSPLRAVAEFARPAAWVSAAEAAGVAVAPRPEPRGSEEAAAARVVERTTSYEARAHFKRIVHVTRTELEKFMFYKVQQLYGEPALQPPPTASNNARGTKTARTEALVADAKDMTDHIAGVVSWILADFARFADAVLRSQREDVAGAVVGEAGSGGRTGEIGGIVAKEVVLRLENLSKRNTTLEVKYNALLGELWSDRRDFLRERAVFLEQLQRIRAHARRRDDAKLLDLLNHDVQFFQEPGPESDEETVDKVREQYENQLASLRKSLEERLAKSRDRLVETQEQLHDTQEQLERTREEEMTLRRTNYKLGEDLEGYQTDRAREAEEFQRAIDEREEKLERSHGVEMMLRESMRMSTTEEDGAALANDEANRAAATLAKQRWQTVRSRLTAQTLGHLTITCDSVDRGPALAETLWPQIRAELLGELRTELRAEFLAEFRDKELSAKVRDELRGELRSEVRRELRAELRDELQRELRDESYAQLRAELRATLGRELRDELRDELRLELCQELGDEFRLGIREELREELRDELRGGLSDELREVLREEFREELREELRRELREELREEARREAASGEGGEPLGGASAPVDALAQATTAAAQALHGGGAAGRAAGGASVTETHDVAVQVDFDNREALTRGAANNGGRDVEPQRVLEARRRRTEARWQPTPRRGPKAAATAAVAPDALHGAADSMDPTAVAAVGGQRRLSKAWLSVVQLDDISTESAAPEKLPHRSFGGGWHMGMDKRRPSTDLLVLQPNRHEASAAGPVAARRPPQRPTSAPAVRLSAAIVGGAAPERGALVVPVPRAPASKRSAVIASPAYWARADAEEEGALAPGVALDVEGHALDFVASEASSSSAAPPGAAAAPEPPPDDAPEEHGVVAAAVPAAGGDCDVAQQPSEAAASAGPGEAVAAADETGWVRVSHSGGTRSAGGATPGRRQGDAPPPGGAADLGDCIASRRLEPSSDGVAAAAGASTRAPAGRAFGAAPPPDADGRGGAQASTRGAPPQPRSAGAEVQRRRSATSGQEGLHRPPLERQLFAGGRPASAASGDVAAVRGATPAASKALGAPSRPSRAPAVASSLRKTRPRSGSSSTRAPSGAPSLPDLHGGMSSATLRGGYGRSASAAELRSRQASSSGA